jgi:ribosome maturation factor RimP
MICEMSLEAEQMITPLFVQAEVELVALTVRPQGGRVVINVLADKPQGGITLDECAGLNRLIVAKIDEQNLFSQGYVLELCSPGLDRALTTKKDFLRVLNRQVKFCLSQPLADQLEYIGKVAAVTDEHVVIEHTAQMLAIPFEKIKKAVQSL